MFWRLLHLWVQHRLLQKHLQCQRIDPDGLAVLSSGRCHAVVLALITLYAQRKGAAERLVEDLHSLYAGAVSHPMELPESHHHDDLHRHEHHQHLHPNPDHDCGRYRLERAYHL